MRKRYVLKNKRRFCTAIIALSVVLSTLFFATSSYGSAEKQYETITVQSGDTLWEIADRYNKGGDIRRIIYEIKEANNLTGSMIYAGDILRIPV